ncbi:hypothetical protein FSB08_00555 [Paraburkholderia sp. JPY432]|nr:hypothetical protein [Paraburkholderia youngii]
MQRTYPYKGFEITVELEPVWEASGSAVLSPPRGFVAIVSVGANGVPTSLISPIRLMKDTWKPFGTEATALMAGCSAGQRLIENTLLPE